jgi:hypothetical protein
MKVSLVLHFGVEESILFLENQLGKLQLQGTYCTYSNNAVIRISFSSVFNVSARVD